MILGDLFDKAQVALSDLLFAYTALSEWLERGRTLYLVSGNHDDEKTSGKLSSFDMLGELLKQYFPHTVAVIKGGGVLTPYGYVISHMPNQQMFDIELLKVPECKVLFLHVNYDNFFAAQSDQSLNISKEQVTACKAKKIVIAHEHVTKQDGKVIIPGNQIPTSVSDWQGCDAKYLTQVTAEGVVTLLKIADRADHYSEQPWDSPEITDHKFVKLVGDATAEQAAQVVSAVAKFRAASSAFVVSNGVRIATESGAAGFGESLESVRAFDVLAALAEVLTKDEMTVLKGLE
jgi:metallophosphoesterase superfamily enzyme